MTVQRLGSNGMRLVSKTVSGRARTALRREAAALDHIGSKRVLELVELVDDESTTTLVTIEAGNRTLAEPGRLGPDMVLRALIDCCVAVEDLHRHNWAHLRLTPDHVVVGPRARVRFCSLSNATPVPSPAEGSGRGRLDREDLRSADIGAVVELIRHCASTPTPPGSLNQRLRWRSMRRRLRSAIEGADVGHADELSRIRGHLGREARRGKVFLAATIAVSVICAISFVARTGNRSDQATPHDRGSADGTPNVVVSGTTMYRVGASEDQLVVGDWDCDGTSTAVLLRPSTGAVYSFPRWATSASAETAVFETVVEGARKLRKTTSECDIATVERPDGSTLRLHPGDS